MPWGPHVLDNLIAPKLSALKVCGAPEVPELPNYRGSLYLNHIFSGVGYPEGTRVLIAGFIGRLGEAISEYSLGRQALSEYVGALPQEQKLGAHRKALMHFETCVLRLHISIVCLQGIGKAVGVAQKVYTVGDGSDYDRLRLMNNRIKHFDEDVEGAIKKGQPVPLAPVWLTNEGLECATASLKFAEIAEIFHHQSEDAKNFSEVFPREALNRRSAAERT